MTNEALLDAGEVPLLLFHLLEWLDVAYKIDVEVFNRKSAVSTLPRGWCQMIIEHIGDGPEVAHQLPRTGIWGMSTAGEINFVRSKFEPPALRGEHEALFFRTVDAGRTVRPGEGIGRVVLHGRLMTDDYALTECARSWIRAFRSRISLRS
jgi:hypothetical protein